MLACFIRSDIFFLCLPLWCCIKLYLNHISIINVIWCNTFTSHLKKLESLQKKAIRALSWSEINFPTHPLFYRFNLLRLAELNEYHNACLMIQIVNSLNPRLSNLVPISSPQHTYQTRIKPLIFGKYHRHVRTRVLFVGVRKSGTRLMMVLRCCHLSPTSKDN